ncbi:MAG: hypothetical protein IIY78_08645 [Clostridia bacterium]|nr:hypothetical protein [Clostridia bacterium]
MSSKNVDKAMKWLEGFTQAAPSTQTMSSFASFSEGCFANYYDNRTIVTDSLNVYMSGLTSTVGLYLMEIRKKELNDHIFDSGFFSEDAFTYNNKCSNKDNSNKYLIQ